MNYEQLLTFRLKNGDSWQITFKTKQPIPTFLEWNKFVQSKEELRGRNDWVLINSLTLSIPSKD